ncbi:SDR family NAD(P)-dependent oxidoreductase [Lolliginicoccus levis]|uniref:SDR family NAD(P)-dependent oxidoreductase n=1 Tax=Lolliginicoccus levis TaxID=2919542 RepID=UPI00241F3DCD|nr:SDR family NAD(P)-dependent oxidoreductase [Lolliginicoccus levis]
MSTFSGKTAVITGAGSGIGRALALQLAAEGAKLALSDVNSVGLEETADKARALGAEVHTAHLNVAEREAMLDYADVVAAHFGTINMVFNNAGIAFTGDVEVSEFKDIERVIDIDFWGVVNGTKAFLPHLIASGDGHVVNISSLFGLVAIPSQAAYNAAKFAVRGFTEALRMEMITNKHPVAVTCVHPGGIKTAIARNATAAEGTDATSLGEFFDKHLARTSPEDAAKRILKDVRRKRARSLIGIDARALDLFQRTTGAGYERIFAAVAGRVMKKAGQIS